MGNNNKIDDFADDFVDEAIEEIDRWDSHLTKTVLALSPKNIEKINLLDIPLTKAERTGNQYQIQKEALARNDIYGGKIFKVFDNAREPSLKRVALNLTKQDELPSYLDISSELLTNIVRPIQKQREAVNAAYQKAKDLGGELYEDAGTKIKNKLSVSNGISDESDAYKVLSKLEKAINTRTDAVGGKIISDVAQFEEGRKVLLAGLNSAKNSSGKVVEPRLYDDMIKTLKSYDDIIDSSNIDNLIKSGGEALDASKDARKMYSEFVKVFGSESVEKILDKLMETESPETALGLIHFIDIEDLSIYDIEAGSPETALDFILGTSVNGVGQITPRLVQELSMVSPEVRQDLKDAVILRLFTNFRNGDDSVITGNTLKLRFQKIFNDSSATAMKRLFEKEEIDRIRETAKFLTKVNVAEHFKNAGSRTAYFSKTMNDINNRVSSFAGFPFGVGTILNSLKGLFIPTQSQVAIDILDEALKRIKAPLTIRILKGFGLFSILGALYPVLGYFALLFATFIFPNSWYTAMWWLAVLFFGINMIIFLLATLSYIRWGSYPRY